jgi:hypothetical protein
MVMADTGTAEVGGGVEAVVVMVVVEGGEVVDLGVGEEAEVVLGVVGRDIWNGMVAWELLGIQWRSCPVS